METENVNFCLAVDKFNNQLTDLVNVYNVMGEQDKAFMLGKAVRIIEVLSNHCMAYGIGIPANQIANIVSEKK